MLRGSRAARTTEPPMQTASWPTTRRWLLLAAALALLNGAVTFHNVWPTPWITTRHELSIELAVLLLALAIYCEIYGPLRRSVAVGLTALLLAMSIGRYAEVTAPALYGRPVNLYWDAQHLPRVAAMLAEVAAPWLVAAIALGAAAALAALAAALHWAVTRVTDGLRGASSRRALGGLAAGVIGLYGVAQVLEWPARHWFSLPVGPTFNQQAAFVLDALALEGDGALPITPLPESDLQQAAGADVLLLFLESYGAAAYDTPSIAAVVAPRRVELEAAAAATGRNVVSAFVESPTFGGASWLAHATLMSGVTVRDTGSYNLLLTQRRETLPTLFSAAGYRTIAWMPGLRNAWPEGAFYGFDAIVGARELDYRGPDFGWWRIPDQYALAKLDALELHGAARAPRFVFFPTINTHIPFRPTPPFQPSLTRTLGEEPYDTADVAASLGVATDWGNLAPAYADTLAYTFRYLAAYLRERANADLVLVLVGDHQPPASVSGTGARWDVPVHVVTARGAISDALLDSGFGPGLVLAPGSAAVADMRELTGLLLRALDSGAGRTGYR
jgi:hypothetical protein